MTLWGSGSEIHSAPGATLEGSTSGWMGWSGITLACPSGGWHDWSAYAGQSAREAGVDSILLGEADITEDVLICIEPWSPRGGYRPVVAWNPSSRGRCP